jgi:hypothetical protein
MKFLLPDLCIPNTYIDDFSFALKEQGHQIVWGSEHLWDAPDESDIDVIASQWAEGYLRNPRIQVNTVEQLESHHLDNLHSQLQRWREKALIIAFVHNVKPRYGKDERLNKLSSRLFEINYDTAHGLVHLGKESISELEAFYPAKISQKPVLLISHGLNELFRTSYPASQGEKSDRFRIFVPGTIRYQSELSFLLRAFWQASIPDGTYKPLNSIQGTVPHKQLIIAGSGSVVGGRHPVRLMRKIVANSLPGVTLFGRRLSDREQYQELLKADIVLSPRLAATNSGIPYLAATYGKRCIVPKVGNLPSVSKELEGILFEPGNCSSLVAAMELAYQQRNLPPLSSQPCPTWQEIAEQIESFILMLKQQRSN